MPVQRLVYKVHNNFIYRKYILFRCLSTGEQKNKMLYIYIIYKKD